MWVVLVVGILNKEYDRGHAPHILQKRLVELPGDLHELFRDILRRDSGNTDELLLCIQLVLFTRQPLRPEQLYSAILSEELSVVDFNDITTDDIKRRILNSSKGLTEVTKSKIPTVQFIHESVKDFLLKDGLQVIQSDFGEKFKEKSHDRLKQCCLKFLEMDISTYIDISSQSVKTPFSKLSGTRQLVNQSIPFLNYAVKNILHHANAAEMGGIDQTKFLETFPLKHWVRLSCFKIEKERYGAPIFAAIATGSGQAVRALEDAQLEKEPDLSVFCTAYSRYHKDRMKQVISRRTVESWEENGVFGYFLRQGEDLLAIAFAKSKQVDVDIETRYDWGRRYLEYAAETGRETVVEWLLDQTIEIDSPDHIGRTPLMLAARWGHEKAVRLLIDRGADIEAMDLDYQTPLFHYTGETST
ncbi:hypothetical protein ACHAQJ_005246 [Trichoderma viride]